MQSRSDALGLLLLVVTGLVAGPGCERGLTAEDAVELGSLALAAGEAPPSPTSRYDTEDDADLIAFLRTLECPPLPPDLGPPTSTEEE